MTTVVQTEGVDCNLSCNYCYQNEIRSSDNDGPEYDEESIMDALDEREATPNLFGGDPLLSPYEKLKRYFEKGMEINGESGIQTNGALIRDEHIKLFKDYNVQVGISCDGPGELNENRTAKSGQTEKMTKKTIENIYRLSEEGLEPNLICTVNAANAGTDERLRKFKDFLSDMKSVCPSINTHMLETSPSADDQSYQLSENRHAEVFLELAKLHEREGASWHPFQDIKNMLMGGERGVQCVWTACDPMTTRHVDAVGPDGEDYNCNRTDNEGFMWHEAEESSYERYASLMQRPQDEGGCKDCRFFVMCRGRCPGEGENNDWRNKTEHCQTVKALFGYYEDVLSVRGETVITEDKERLSEIEDKFMSMIMDSEPPILSDISYAGS